MNSICRILLSIVLIACSYSLKASGLVIGEEQIFKSAILKEDRRLQVYLPDSYQKTKKHYPVLFVMDSQRYFLHAIAHQKTLRFQDKTPELIVVGLTTDNDKRRKWLYPDREAFIKFLSQELVPWIHDNYRASEERLYFGWEMAAGLVPDLIVNQPDLFQAYFMASPTHVNRQRIDNIARYLQQTKSEHFIYATLGSVETWSTPSMALLDKAVKASSSNSMNWQYDLLDDQDHYTTPLLTIDNGLLKFYSDYGPVRFYSIKEFNDFGGMAALKKHYENRGERFGISAEIHDDTKGYLLNQSLKEDNLKLFSSLVDNFEGFIEDYYVTDFWFNRFANAYIKLGELAKAKKMLKTGIAKRPKSHLLHASLGQLYLQLDNISSAKTQLNTAISLAKDDEKALQQYQTSLQQLDSSR